MRILAAGMAVVFLFTLSGCSLFAAKTQSVSVTTSEDDAQIFINGNLAGVGVAMMRVPRNQDVGIMAKKEGYYPSMRTVGTTLSTVGIVDIIGGAVWLVPFFGLLAPGAHELETNNITLIMAEKEESKS